jgi:hypothetical protein
MHGGSEVGIIGWKAVVLDRTAADLEGEKLLSQSRAQHVPSSKSTTNGGPG